MMSRRRIREDALAGGGGGGGDTPRRRAAVPPPRAAAAAACCSGRPRWMERARPHTPPSLFPHAWGKRGGPKHASLLSCSGRERAIERVAVGVARSRRRARPRARSDYCGFHAAVAKHTGSGPQHRRGERFVGVLTMRCCVFVCRAAARGAAAAATCPGDCLRAPRSACGLLARAAEAQGVVARVCLGNGQIARFPSPAPPFLYHSRSYRACKTLLHTQHTVLIAIAHGNSPPLPPRLSTGCLIHAAFLPPYRERQLGERN